MENALPPLPAVVPDYGPPERWHHATRDYVADEDGQLAAHVLEECALDRWRLVGALSEVEHRAGLRLRADYIMAGLLQQQAQDLSSSLSRRPRHSGWESAAERRTPAAEAAYQRWHDALREVRMAERRILVNVVCHDEAFPWAARSELREALAALVKYYKM